MESGKVQCPKCLQIVRRVDGEYDRHYVGSELCTKSKREIEDNVTETKP